MALFRTRTPAKPIAMPETLSSGNMSAVKSTATKKVEMPSSIGAPKGSGGILQELGIYTLPNELKAEFRKLREEVQRFLVDENHVAGGMPSAKLRELVEPIYS